VDGTSVSRPWTAASKLDQSNGARSPLPRHQNGDPQAPGTLWYPWERRSGPPGEHSAPCKGGHKDRTAVHLGLEYAQTDVRGKVSSQSEVGHRQVQQALRLLTQGQSAVEEIYPNDKREIAGRQVPQTKVRECTHWSLSKTARPSRGRQMLVVRRQRQDGGPDAGTPLLPLQPERLAKNIMKGSEKGNGLESGQMPTCADL